MRVAIVGGGLGGLAAAVATQRYVPDVKLRVYERDAHPQARPQGYTITLNQRGMSALTRLDLSARTEQHARLPLPFHVMKCDAKTLIKMPPQDKGPGRVYPVLRETLHEMLLGQMSDASIIRWGAKVAGYKRGPEGFTLDVDGATEGPYDVVLGADGVRSVIRQQLLGDKFKSLGLVTFFGTSGALITDPLIASSSCFFVGKGASFLSVVTPDLQATNFWFALRPTRPLPPPEQELDVDAMAKELEEHLASQAWYPPIAALLRQELLGQRLKLRHLVGRDALPVWPTEGVTLLGDAAHPMTPYRGQGANTALADGVNFGLALAKSAGRDWRPTLREYEEVMRTLGNKAAEQSQSSADFFHPRSQVAMWARDGMLQASAASMRWAALLGRK